jgi:hypothetical protein
MSKILILLVGLLLALPVGSAHALRCGTALVTAGDHKIDVLQKCGDPVSIDTRTAYQVIQKHHKHHTVQRELVIPITIEEWIYNFGPRQFMRWLRFENGRLVKIRALQYGY